MLLFLLWQYIYKKYKVNYRTVLLFDEPDAHLHPSSVKSFLSIVQELVELGLQVIMTTHNPTTVSMVPNENLFFLDNQSNTSELAIRDVDSKYEAINMLTENFVYVAESFRLVFTEGNGTSDNFFFNHLKKLYFQLDGSSTSKPFLFRSIGSCQFRHFFDKKLIETESISFDDYAKIGTLIYGIIDGDTNIVSSYEYFIEIAKRPEYSQDFDLDKLENSLKVAQQFKAKFSENLLMLERHSIENYIYDPINIFFSLKKGAIQEFLKFPEEFDVYKTKYSLKQFLEDETLLKNEKEELLNGIIYITSEALIENLSSNVSSNKGKLYEFKNTFGFKTEDLSQMLKICKKLPSFEKFSLRFKINNIEQTLNLKYNPLLIFLQGHLIERFFNGNIAFSVDEKKQRIKWYEKLDNDTTGFLFTNDLYELIKKIAN